MTTRLQARKVPSTPKPYSIELFQRIHIDHAGPFMNTNCLIITDNFSKWIEIY